MLNEAKRREEGYQRVMLLTQRIEKEMVEQQHLAQKWQIAVGGKIAAAERALEVLFDNAEKEQKRGETAL